MNKKGFTIIEILICVSLLASIALIGIVQIRKETKTDEKIKEEYTEALKLESGLLYDRYKTNEKFSGLVRENDWVIIQLGDLIDEGLLEETIYNPYRNTTVGDFREDCIKIILNKELIPEIDPEPAECRGKTKEEIQVMLNENYFIHINQNDSITNKVVLEDSYDMLRNNGTSLINDIQNGNYIEENFIDPGVTIKNNNGLIIEGIDINVDYEYDEDKKAVLYTYSVDENSPKYDKFEIKSVTREVKYSDTDGPIIKYAYNDWGYSEGDWIYFSFPTSSSHGYMDFWSLYNYASSEYQTFDNYDGVNYFNLEDYYDYYYFETFDWISNYYMTDQIEVMDSVGNSRNYNIEISPYYNEPPYIYYDGPTWMYDSDVYYSNGEIYPFYDHIYVEDSDSYYGASYYYYLYDNYGNYYYTYNNTYIPSGDYTLYIEAMDDYDYTYTLFDIYIDYYHYEEPYYGCEYYGTCDYYEPSYGYEPGYDYCDIACQMYNNSQEWWGASPEEQERLHQENEYLSQFLPDDTYYTPDGYWHNSDGSLLYDPAEPYYGYDPGYGYGYDPGYDCCW